MKSELGNSAIGNDIRNIAVTFVTNSNRAIHNAANRDILNSGLLWLENVIWRNCSLVELSIKNELELLEELNGK